MKRNNQLWVKQIIYVLSIILQVGKKRGKNSNSPHFELISYSSLSKEGWLL